MIYKIKKNEFLILSDNIITTMNLFKQTNNRKENGGILLGKIYINKKIYIVNDISTTSKKDKQGFNFFIRNKEFAQKVVNNEWYKSEGINNYLGEWHTHNQVNPKPSQKDKKLLKDCFQENIMEYDRLFMIILGKTGKLFVSYMDRNMKTIKHIYKVGR